MMVAGNGSAAWMKSRENLERGSLGAPGAPCRVGEMVAGGSAKAILYSVAITSQLLQGLPVEGKSGHK